VLPDGWLSVGDADLHNLWLGIRASATRPLAASFNYCLLVALARSSAPDLRTKSMSLSMCQSIDTVKSIQAITFGEGSLARLFIVA
jgi:hypothetical protein